MRRAFFLTLGFIVAAEIACRAVLGLGDPPLFVGDAKIGYYAKPAAEYSRFGNRVAYNQWSMRSPEFPQTKSSDDEYRVLVIGDSVVNGGALTDQSKLATELMQRQLQAAMHRPVVVGNISAGGWGATNQLEFVRRFGFFDADAVIIVVSSHDYEAPTSFAPIETNPNTPVQAPVLALTEALERYAPRYLPTWITDAPPAAELSETERLANVVGSTRAFRQLVELAQAKVANVFVAQHLTSLELAGKPEPGHDALARIASDAGACVIQLGPAFAESLARGEQPFRDEIHPTALGQSILSDVLSAELLKLNRTMVAINRTRQPRHQ